MGKGDGILDDFQSRPSAVQATTRLNKREIDIRLGSLHLRGELAIPGLVKGLVLFAHGSGSSRFSPRNQYVAYELNKAEMATCLFDLLSLEEEEEDQINNRYRFDIPMLAQRLVQVTDWIQDHLIEATALPIGYFGASTGAAAALLAASERPNDVKAVVSRGGRPDMATHALPRVQAATLLLVGALDEIVLSLNRKAFQQLPVGTPKELVVIPEATHLFEEPGRLEQVAQYAAQWFEKYLTLA
jgi:putative phosphoribosyl transferase